MYIKTEHHSSAEVSDQLLEQEKLDHSTFEQVFKESVNTVVEGEITLPDVENDDLIYHARIYSTPPSLTLPEPEGFLAFIKLWSSWTDFGSYTSHEQKLNVLFALFMQLEVPTDIVGYWNRIPQQDILPTLNHLERLLRSYEYTLTEYSKVIPENLRSIYVFRYLFIMHMAAAISHTSAKQVAGKELTGWAIPCCSLFKEGNKDAGYFFNLGFEQKKLEALVHYFKQQNQNTKGAILNWIPHEGETLSYEKRTLILRSLDEGIKLSPEFIKQLNENASSSDPLAQHFLFLAQFVKPSHSLEFKDFESAFESPNLSLQIYQQLESILWQIKRFDAWFMHGDPSVYQHQQRFLLLHTEYHHNMRQEEFPQTTLKMEKGEVLFRPAMHVRGDRSPDQLPTSTIALRHAESIEMLEPLETESSDENKDSTALFTLKSESGLMASQQFLQELGKLSRPYNNQLRIPLLLNWMKKYRYYLRNSDIQKWVFQLLMRSEEWQNTLQNAPEVVQSLRTFFIQIVNEDLNGALAYRHNALAWMRLGIFIENQLHPTSFSESQLDFYQNQLENILSKELLTDPLHMAQAKLLLILSHSHKVEISFEEGKRFIGFLFNVETALRGFQGTERKADRDVIDLWRVDVSLTMLRWKDQLTLYFQDRSFNAYQWVANELKGHISGIIRNEFPNYRIRGQRIECLTGVYPFTLMQDNTKWPKVFNSYLKELNIALGLQAEDTVLFDAENKEIKALDDSFHCFFTQRFPSQNLYSLNHENISKQELDVFYKKNNVERLVIKKSITLAGERLRYEYISTPYFEFLPFSLFRNFSHWLSLPLESQKDNPRTILIFDTKNRPFARIIILNEKQFSCEKLDPQSQAPIATLALGKTLPSSMQAYLQDYFGTLLLSEVLIFTKDKKVTSLELPSFGLTFSLSLETPSSPFICDQFPEFYLQPQAERSKYHFGETAILLKNMNGKMLVLLPAHAFDTPLFLFGKEHHYFLFDFVEKSQRFSSELPLANLYLTAYFIANNNPLLAMEALDEVDACYYYGDKEYALLKSLTNRYSTINRFHRSLDPPSLEIQLTILHLALHFSENSEEFFATQPPPITGKELRAALINNTITEFGQNLTVLKEKPLHPRFYFTRDQSKVLSTKFSNKAAAALKKETQAPQIKAWQIEMPAGYEWSASPLLALGSLFFDEKSEPLYLQEPFVLSGMEIDENNLLAKTLLENLEKGHAENLQKVTQIYTLKGSTEDLKRDLLEQLNNDKLAQQALRLEIETLANTSLETQELTFHRDIFRALSAQSRGTLLQINPHLDEATLQKIGSLSIGFMLYESRIDQLQDALSKMKKFEECTSTEAQADLLQDLAKILYKKRIYDPIQEMHFLTYEFSTLGIILRPQQVELLRWIKEQQHAEKSQIIVEFPAGGGKTKIVEPLVVVETINDGKFPVVVSLPALYTILKSDLQTTLKPLKVHLLELELDSVLSREQLTNIYKKLKRWHREKACLLITPITYHKLHILFYQNANEPHHPAHKIIFFLRNNCRLITDETHKNVTSTWQANYSFGERLPLAPHEQSLFIVIHKLLIGALPCQLPSGEDISSVVSIEKDQQSLLSKTQREAVFKALATWMCQNYFTLPIEKQDEAILYLTDKKRQTPEWIASSFSQKEQETFILCRGFMTKILKLSFKMRHYLDYGPPTKGNKIAMPRSLKIATGAHFADPDIAGALSCQSLFQRGLNALEMKEVLFLLQKEHAQESALMPPHKTHATLTFRSWQTDEPFVDLDTLSIENAHDVEMMVEKIGRSREVIEHYLAHSLLREVKLFSKKTTSTAADLTAGGHSAILFSATVGFDEQYPYPHPTLDKTQPGPNRASRRDFAFTAAVIQRSCMPHNSETLWLVEKDRPKELFEQIYAADPSVFETGECIGDLRGWNRHWTGKEVALDFLDFSAEHNLPYDGTLDILESASEDGVSSMVVTLAETRERIFLQGSDLLMALKQKGYENLRLFKVIAPSQCTGLDVAFSKQAKMIFVFDRLWDNVQTIMRQRDFLNPILDEKAPRQSILWIGTSKLKEKIGKGKEEVKPQDIWKWSFAREVKEAQPNIIMRACQDIVRVIRDQFENRVYPNYDRQFVDAHSEGIVFETIERDLIAHYASTPASCSTRELLTNFTSNLLQKAQISKDELAKLKGAEERIEAIIQETEHCIAQATVIGASNSTSTTHTQQQQQQIEFSKVQQKKQTADSSSSQKLSPHKRKKYASLNKLSIKNLENKNRVLANARLFDNEGILYPHLYLLSNVYITCIEKKTSLKSIDFFMVELIQETEGQFTPIIYAVSQEDAKKYCRRLRSGSTPADSYMALMTATGDVAQNGNIPQPLMQSMRESLLWKKILNDIGLINNRLHDAAFFEKEQVPLLLQTMDASRLCDLISQTDRLQNRQEESDALLMKQIVTKMASQQPPKTPQPIVPYILYQEPKPKSPIIPPSTEEVDVQVEEVDVQVDIVAPLITQPTVTEPPAQTPTWKKVVSIISLIFISLVFIGCGCVGALGFIGGSHFPHIPQFVILVYQTVHTPGACALTTVSGLYMMVGLVAYIIYYCKHRSKPLGSGDTT